MTRLEMSALYKGFLFQKVTIGKEACAMAARLACSTACFEELKDAERALVTAARARTHAHTRTHSHGPRMHARMQALACVFRSALRGTQGCRSYR